MPSVTVSSVSTDTVAKEVHKLSITYTCVDADGQVLRRGRVANTAEGIGEIVAPSGGQAWAAPLTVWEGVTKMQLCTKEVIARWNNAQRTSDLQNS